MLIDQRRPGAGMLQPPHQFLEARARPGRERPAGMPGIMKVQVWHPYRFVIVVPAPNRDAGALFRLIRQYASASQTQIAIAWGRPRPKAV
jgi:hypothetical protein